MIRPTANFHYLRPWIDDASHLHLFLRIYNEQPSDGSWRFELTVVNPTLVLGPMLHKSHSEGSMEVVMINIGHL